MSFRGLWGAVLAVVGLAVVAVLVRSGSQAPALASSLGTAGAQVLAAAEGQPFQG
jgi:hypothetical protein